MVWLVLLIPVNIALALVLFLPRAPAPQLPWDEAPHSPAPSWKTRLQQSHSELVDAAGIPLSPTTFLAIRTGIAVGGGAFMGLLLGPVSALLGAAAGWLLVGEWARARKEARLLRCAEQFREVLQSIVSSLRAGRSMPQALQQAYRDLHQIPGREGDLMSQVLEQALSELSLGAPLDNVLQSMARRVPLEEIRLFADAVIISRVRGGNLVQVLLTLIRLNMERFQVRQEVRIQTAQKRLEGSMVSAMPLAMLLLLTLMAPDYMAPLTRTAGGQALVGLGLFLVLVAYLYAQSMARIEV